MNQEFYKATERFRKRSITAAMNRDEYNLQDYYRNLRVSRELLFEDLRKAGLM